MSESINQRAATLSSNRDARGLRALFGAVRTTVNSLITGVNELIADHATSRAWDVEVDADLDAINNYNDFCNGPDGVVGGNYTFTAGQANATITGAGFVIYRINGAIHYAVLDTTITIEDNAAAADVADGRFGAWRIVIDRLGAVTTQKASADQQHTSAEIAALTLGSVAQTANTACLGYAVLGDVGAAFNIGTTTLDALTTENYYYERQPRKQCSGLHTALGAATVASAGTATLAVGTIDPHVQGVRLAQIAADATDDFTDADTIATLETGGWLLVTDLAGTGTSTISSDGVAGVSALADTDLATCNTALDTLTDNLPSMFVPLARIVVVNASGGTFTCKTTFWDAASITTTVTDATVGTWDRTANTGFDSHKLAPPAIPATITAPTPTTLTASTVTTSLDE